MLAMDMGFNAPFHDHARVFIVQLRQRRSRSSHKMIDAVRRIMALMAKPFAWRATVYADTFMYQQRTELR